MIKRVEGISCKLSTLNEYMRTINDLARTNTQLILQARREQLGSRSCVAGVRVEMPREAETEV